MKKKIAIAIIALMVLGTSGAFAFGIGLQLNGNADDSFENRGVALTFKVDSIPLIFAVNWGFYDEVQWIGVTADYWFLNNRITSIGRNPLNWFIGIGLFGNVTVIEDDDTQIAFGVRVPVGLNMFIGNGFFEPFVQIAPSFGVRVVPSLGMENLFFPISLGFRCWFK